MLQAEQIFFAGQSAAIPAHLPVGANHAMAGNDDGNWIVVIGAANGAAGLWLSNGDGNVLIAGRAAVRNGAQGLPDRQLKGGPEQLQGEGEPTQMAGKVGR